MSCGEDNPFYSMIEIMRRTKGQSLPPFLIGKVTVTAPLTVQVGDIPITRKNMKINSMLLSGYSRSIAIGETGATGTTGNTSGGSNEASFASHGHSIQSVGIPNGRMVWTDGLQVGDEVLLQVSADGQQYILIAKVV